MPLEFVLLWSCLNGGSKFVRFFAKIEQSVTLQKCINKQLTGSNNQCQQFIFEVCEIDIYSDILTLNKVV